MNTKCRTYLNRIPAFVEGDLTPVTHANLEAHLLDCPICRQELAAYLALVRDLQDAGDAVRKTVLVPEELFSPDLQRKIEENLSQDNARDPLDSALYALGAQLRALAPQIDVADSVMARLAAEEAVLSEFDEEALEESLYALGADLRRHAPRVNLHDAIMAAVAKEQRPDKHAESHTATVVDLAEYRRRQAAAKTHQRPRRTLANMAYWGLAACVLLLIGAASFQILFGPTIGFPGLQTATGPGAGTMQQDDAQSLQGDGGAEADGMQQRLEEMGAMQQIINDVLGERPEVAEEDRPTRQAMERITLKEVLDARVKAGQQDQDAINTLQQWAGLTSAEAQELLEAGMLDAEALIGAGIFLTPEEAIAMLQEAIQEDPDNPFLRYALAKNLGLEQDSLEATLQQLDAWAALDTENALPHYYGALAHFGLGDVDAAMASLYAADSMNRASAYGLDAAQYTEALLMASGMDAETARFLAATTAGSGQYADLTALSQELLEYGAYYESIGDYDTAREIYESVNRLGAQVADGAQVANERLAGLDIQHQSMNAFEGLHEILVDPVSLQILEQTFNNFVQALNDFAQYMEAYNQLLALADVDLARLIADIIMQQGDLDIFSYMP